MIDLLYGSMLYVYLILRLVARALYVFKIAVHRAGLMLFIVWGVPRITGF